MAGSSKDIQLIEFKDMIFQLNTAVKALNETIARRQSENNNLRAELAWFRQRFFGSSGERRTDDVAGQLSFFGTLPEEEKPTEVIEPEVVSMPKKTRKAKPSFEEPFKDIPTRKAVVAPLSDEEKKPTLYFYEGRRKCETIPERNRTGILFMADGYQGCNKVRETNRCRYYAHIRKYLLEAIPKGHEKDYSHPAVQSVLYCDKLFEYGRLYREKGLSYKQIENRRPKDQKLVIEGFLLWMEQVNPDGINCAHSGILATGSGILIQGHPEIRRLQYISFQQRIQLFIRGGRQWSTMEHWDQPAEIPGY